MLATTFATPKNALEEALFRLGCYPSVLYAMAKLAHMELYQLDFGSTQCALCFKQAADANA